MRLKKETQSLRQRQMYAITWRIVFGLPGSAVDSSGEINDMKCKRKSLASYTSKAVIKIVTVPSSVIKPSSYPIC